MSEIKAFWKTLSVRERLHCISASLMMTAIVFGGYIILSIIK